VPAPGTQPIAEQFLYADFLTFRLDLTRALLINRANVVYRERWNLDARAVSRSRWHRKR
jgi:hypothetical protein